MKAFGPTFPIRAFDFEQIPEPYFADWVSHYRTTLLANLWFAPPISVPFIHYCIEFSPNDPTEGFPLLSWSFDASHDYIYVPLTYGLTIGKFDLTDVDLSKLRVRLTSITNKKYIALTLNQYSRNVASVVGEVQVASPLDVVVTNGRF
jgi:hypothetical protein